MTSTHQEQFPEARKQWNLEKLYTDLGAAKKKLARRKIKGLTEMEKQHLCGLLSGYSPTEIAKALHKAPKGVEVDLSKTLYRYIEVLTDRYEFRNWKDFIDGLEKAGYKIKPLPNPQPAIEANDLGVEYYINNQLPLAIVEFSRALEQDPNLGATHYNLGVVAEDLQDFAQARAEYKLAMEAGVAAAWNNWGRLEIMDVNYATAVDLLRKGLTLAEHNVEKYTLWKNLGWAYLQQGRYNEAEACLLEAIEFLEKQASAYCLLAQVWEQQGKQAQEAWEKCLCYASSHNPDEDAWIGLAKQRLAVKDNQE